MLPALTAILCCQLAGEALVMLTGLPVPGPVIGMVLLFTGLTILGRVPTEIAAVGDGLLRHLSLMFVPAGVGVMLYLGTLQEEAGPLALALIVSGVLGIAVTALAMVWLTRLTGGDTAAGKAGGTGRDKQETPDG